MTPSRVAHQLLAARLGKASIGWRDILPANRHEAYAVQDATLAQLGPIAGWKVGAKNAQLEPICAPLPAIGLLPTSTTLTGPPWRLRGVEVELALRVGQDLDTLDLLSPCELQSAFDAVLPAIEVVETRLADWKGSDALVQLADLQSHGALVLGEPSAIRPAELDLRTLEAQLNFNGQPVAHTQGGNPAADLWRMLGWLAQHCARRGHPLGAGQIVTTGSCTGMLFAPEGAWVQGQLVGIGKVEVQF